jgi:hypothetical protein
MGFHIIQKELEILSFYFHLVGEKSQLWQIEQIMI